MNIILRFGICVLLALLLDGCAHAPAAGGVAANGIEGNSEFRGGAQGQADDHDYRRVLGNPGPF